MKYPVTCIKINTKTPIMICRVICIDKITLEPKIELKLEDLKDSQYKRHFLIRLLEAVKKLPTSDRDIKKIKKRRRRKNK